MPIAFNTVPNNLRINIAAIEFDNSQAVQGPSQLAYKILVLGQRLSSGSKPALTPVRVTSDTQAADYFGAGSMLHGMFQALFANDRTTEKWAIALDDDSSAVAASGSIKFTGSQTKDGTIFLYIGGRRLTIGASTADALDDIAYKINAAINADPNLQVTSVVNTTDDTQVDITAKNAGEAGNFIDIRVNYRIGEETPEGLSPSITTMSGGTSNPDLSSAIAAMGEEQFNIIAQPYTDTNSLDDIGVELLDRWGPMRQNDGVSISASALSFTDVATLGSSRNSFLSSIISSYKSPTPPHEWAAALSGIVAFHGAIDQARPFQTLAVNWVLPPEPQDRLTNEERNLLLYDGISTQKTASGQVIVDRLITNYQKNALGAEDISYLNLNTVLNLSYLRFDLRSTFQRKYPRHKLARDGTRFGPGQLVMTPNLAKAETTALARSWEFSGRIENVDEFIEATIVEIDESNPDRLNMFLQPNLINQFRVLAAQIGFVL